MNRMNTQDNSLDRTAAVSVSDIVRMSIGKADDPWKLALVQRDVVWNEIKVAKLLDSLLRGYPIGYLIVCSTAESANAYDRRNRKLVSAGESLQLLDGQQRCFALSALFHGMPFEDRGERVHFYLNLCEDYPELQPGKDDKKISSYITWGSETKDPFDGAHRKSRQGRKHWVDISLLGKRLLRLKTCRTMPDFDGMDAAALLKWLQHFDPEFNALPKRRKELAASRLKRLVHSWFAPEIPVQHVLFQNEEDVLQVYSRCNMEGVKTTQADVFFAGVKTRWHEAEYSLDRLRDDAQAGESPLFSRLHALRLVVRLASFEQFGDDLMPLKLAKLRGEKGRTLVNEMERLCRDPRLRRRLRKLCDYLVNDSGMGYALWHVDSHLLDHVFGWALSEERLSKKNLRAIAGYLFWGTAFRLNPVFREAFSRNAMRVAMRNADSDFPLVQILQGVKKTWPGLAYRRSEIPRPFGNRGAVDRAVARNLVHHRGRLFLAMVQNVPYDPDYDIDWEHICPRARRPIMKWRPGGERLQFHPAADSIWRAGNLCALESSLNRSLGQKKTQKKHAIVRKRDKAGTLQPADLFMSEQQWKTLKNAETAIIQNSNPRESHENEAMDEALKQLAAFVAQREDRLWDTATKAFPTWRVFRDVLFMD